LLKIYALHGSVATQLKCGGIFDNYVIANCPQYVSVKEFWKSVNIWQKYEKWQSGTFLGDTVFKCSRGCCPSEFQKNV